MLNYREIDLFDKYDREAPILREFSSKLEVLLADLLAAEKFRVHSVSTRVKSRESLENKVSRQVGKYDALDQVTDLCGARVITCFEDDVDAISKLMETEFEIDTVNSIDKRQSFDPDRFGYVSVHYIACLNPSRSNLAEYRRYGKIKFELQIRSILQHAWAEIEHDLQYKSQEAIPRELRRRFARLAGLLEVADEEFKGIRDSIRDYQRHVAVAVTTDPGGVRPDAESLRALVAGDPLITDIDGRIAAILEVPVAPMFLDTTVILNVFSHAGLDTIQSVLGALIANRDHVVNFARLWLQRPGDFVSPIASFSRGISLFYLAYILILKAQTQDDVEATLALCHYPAHDHRQFAKDLLETYQQLRA